MSIEGLCYFLPYIFQALYVLCFTGPRYQVSVYRTIGPLVYKKFPQNFTKYFKHHPLSADTSFKFLSLILFEMWHLQIFISIFSKGRNFTRGNNSKKNTGLLFFHEESIYEVSRRYLIPEYHSCKISGSKILKKGNKSKNII